jgi:hypothetical protein
MKKAVLFLGLMAMTSVSAQWNYDNQNMIYHNLAGNTVSVGTTAQGNYGASDKAFEVNSTSNFAVFSLRAASNNIQIINSATFGNSFALPNSSAFSFNMGGVSTGANPALRINTNGSIGIATALTPTGYKLAVGGKIIAEELKVQLQTAPWPDYVFEPGYKLPALSDVEKYIQENGHLTQIPSAKEVELNGFEVGEMNRLLLQKVEELTLYLIEQNKEIAALKAKYETTQKTKL